MSRVTAFAISLAGAAATLLALAAPAIPAHASDGRFDLSWDGCTGPLDRAIGAAAGPVSLYATVIGFDVPFKAYQVQMFYGNSSTTDVPDAWEFDAAGCQGSGLVSVDHLAPAQVAKTCPTLQGAVASLQIKDVSRIGDLYPGWADPDYMRITMANALGDNVVTPLAGTRYFVLRVVFDHTFSVEGAGTPGADCGGVEQPICFAVLVATYLTADGIEINWGYGGNRYATVHGSFGCPAIPAQVTTWGAIKRQYRN